MRNESNEWVKIIIYISLIIAAFLIYHWRFIIIRTVWHPVEFIEFTDITKYKKNKNIVLIGCTNGTDTGMADLNEDDELNSSLKSLCDSVCGEKGWQNCGKLTEVTIHKMMKSSRTQKGKGTGKKDSAKDEDNQNLKLRVLGYINGKSGGPLKYIKKFPNNTYGILINNELVLKGSGSVLEDVNLSRRLAPFMGKISVLVGNWIIILITVLVGIGIILLGVSVWLLWKKGEKIEELDIVFILNNQDNGRNSGEQQEGNTHHNQRQQEQRIDLENWANPLIRASNIALINNLYPFDYLPAVVDLYMEEITGDLVIDWTGRVLDWLITLGPKMGFLGTVLGMINVFSLMESAGSFSIAGESSFISGMEIALVTTVFGLVGSIIGKIMDSLLEKRIKSLYDLIWSKADKALRDGFLERYGQNASGNQRGGAGEQVS